MKVCLIQMDVVLGDVKANQEKALSMMEEGLKDGAELFVLPEMWTTGYKLDEIHLLAEPEDGQTIKLLKHFARQHSVDIIAGSIAEQREGKVYNTSYAIERTGEIIAKYSKIHLIGLMDEDKYLTAGNEKCLFNGSTGNAGIIICYDLRFVELPRTLALKGCQTLFVPAEWPTIRGQHWTILNVARAIENQMFVICVNRVGTDPNNEFFGHSMIVNPWGEIMAEGSDSEQVITVEVDFKSAVGIRNRMPIFADRRPECY